MNYIYKLAVDRDVCDGTKRFRCGRLEEFAGRLREEMELVRSRELGRVDIFGDVAMRIAAEATGRE